MMNRTPLRLVVASMLWTASGFLFAQGDDVQIIVADTKYPAVATADCRTNRIYVDRRYLSQATESNLADVIAHELAHLITDCEGHSERWRMTYQQVRGDI